MKKIDVTIKGLCPLLHHRFPGEEHSEGMSKAKKKVYDPEEEAEKALYRDEKDKIYQPAEHILQAMTKAGSRFKFSGQKTYKEIILTGIEITPEAIPLHKKTWDEIDARRAVVQRHAVIRWRPKFNDWEVSFQILITDPDNITVQIVKEILETAGKNIGIGDYRPRFGRFMITSFKEVN